MKNIIKHPNPIKQGKFSQTNYQFTQTNHQFSQTNHYLPSPINSRPKSMESNNNKSGYLQQTKSSQNRSNPTNNQSNPTNNQPNLKQRQFINKKNVFNADYNSTQQYSSTGSNPKSKSKYTSNPRSSSNQNHIPHQHHYQSNHNHQHQYQPVSCSQNLSNIQQLQKTNKTDVDLDQIEYETQIYDQIITQKDYQRQLEEKDKEIQELTRRNSQLEKINQQLKDNVYKERINYEQQLMKINKNIQGLKTMQQEYQDIKYQLTVKDQLIKEKDQSIQQLQQKIKDLTDDLEYFQSKKTANEQMINEQEYFSFNQHMQNSFGQQMQNSEEQPAFQYTLDNQSIQEEEDKENKSSIFNVQPIKHSIFDITRNKDKKEVQLEHEANKNKQSKDNSVKQSKDINPKENNPKDTKIRQDICANEDKENKSQSINQKDKYAYVIYDFNAQRENDISLKKGQKVKILQMKDNGWWIGICDSKIGFFPYNYVELV